LQLRSSGRACISPAAQVRHSVSWLWLWLTRTDIESIALPRPIPSAPLVTMPLGGRKILGVSSGLGLLDKLHVNQLIPWSADLSSSPASADPFPSTWITCPSRRPLAVPLLISAVQVHLAYGGLGWTLSQTGPVQSGAQNQPRPASTGFFFLADITPSLQCSAGWVWQRFRSGLQSWC
jgi:hypothetical protein